MASNRRAMASNLIAMASNLMAMASNLIAMASNLRRMASNLRAMASNPIEIASNRRSMASKLVNSDGLQPKKDGLQPKSTDALILCWFMFSWRRTRLCRCGHAAGCPSAAPRPLRSLRLQDPHAEDEGKQSQIPETAFVRQTAVRHQHIFTFTHTL